MYYRQAQAAIVVFDVTNKESFEGAMQWVKDVVRKTEPGLVIALCGNKTDLAHLRRVEAEVRASLGLMDNARLQPSRLLSGPPLLGAIQATL